MHPPASTHLWPRVGRDSQAVCGTTSQHAHLPEPPPRLFLQSLHTQGSARCFSTAPEGHSSNMASTSLAVGRLTLPRRRTARQPPPTFFSHRRGAPTTAVTNEVWLGLGSGKCVWDGGLRARLQRGGAAAGVALLLTATTSLPGLAAEVRTPAPSRGLGCAESAAVEAPTPHQRDVRSAGTSHPHRVSAAARRAAPRVYHPRAAQRPARLPARGSRARYAGPNTLSPNSLTAPRVSRGWQSSTSHVSPSSPLSISYGHMWAGSQSWCAAACCSKQARAATQRTRWGWRAWRRRCSARAAR